MLTVIAWAATGAILATYLAVAAGRWPVRVFHQANALGAVPVCAVQARAGVWPGFVLTFAFGTIGLVGWVGRR